MTNANKMTLERFRAVVQAYGGDPKSWPEDERTAAQALLATSNEAQALVEAETDLDQALQTLPPVREPDWLAAKITANLPEPSGFQLASLWPFGPIWRPVSGLVAAMLLGVVLGVSTPQAADEPSIDALSAATYLALGIDIDEVTQ